MTVIKINPISAHGEPGNNMCAMPHNEIMISPNGDFRVCSLINGHEFEQGLCRDAKGVAMNVLTHTFEEAMNSGCHKYLRAQHQQNAQPSMCSCCFDRDQLPGGNSMRTYKTFEIPNKISDWVNTPGPVVHIRAPIGLDLRFGVLCNLQCVVCGPWYSDKWNADFLVYTGKDTIKFAGKTISILPDAPRVGEINGVAWWESDIWWDKFNAIKPTLRHLYFTGGEPMIVPAHNRVLSELVEGGFAKDIVMEIDTNLTALNPRIISQWRHFKQIDLRVSVDAIHDQYTVVRYPGKFSRIENNLKTLLADMPPNIRLIVTTCVTPLTAFSMREMDEWAVALGIKTTKPVHRRFIEEPYSLSIKFANKSIKDKLAAWLLANPSEYSPVVLAYIQNNYESYHPQSETLVKYMDFLDSRRGTNWRGAFGTAAYTLGL